ncbi:MAG: CDP-alcohol phosphatidyltransferase family protein [Candidatus Kapaibacteriales bacterium]
MDNLPNILTIIRLVLLIPINIFMFTRNKEIALSLIFIAWITDLLDGYLARKLNAVSVLGKMLDPIADKLLIFSIVLSLIFTKIIPYWLGITIIVRDLLILSAGLLTIRQYKYVIQSNWVGKSSAFLIGATLFVLLIIENTPVQTLLYITLLAVVILSLLLYYAYYRKTLAMLKSKNS